MKQNYESTIRKVRKLNEKYNAFITICDDAEGKNQGRLKGFAISVKDNICTKGIQTTAGSKILEGYIPPFDATVVEKCKKEGASILGKTSQDEFGFGTFSINTPYGTPKNPIDTSRSCGGSSGGAACVTALADFPHIAIAESTGGSISCPAAWCGVVGITPTYGRVSRWGLIDFANSLDKIGCIGKNVKDAALLLSVINGPDKYDSTVSQMAPEDFTKNLDSGAKGLKIGVPKEYFGEGVDSKVADVVWDGIKKLESEGAEYQEVSLPYTKFSLASYYIIAMAEASTNLNKFCGMRYGLQGKIEGNYDEYFSKIRSRGFTEEAKRRIILGTFTRIAGFREAYYLKALKVRTKVIQDFKSAFKKFDVLAAPTMPVIAPKFDEIAKLEPLQHYMMDILTVAPNLAGIPMVSVPCGRVGKMPVGMHIMADHMNENMALRVAHAMEATT